MSFRGSRSVTPLRSQFRHLNRTTVHGPLSGLSSSPQRLLYTVVPRRRSSRTLTSLATMGGLSILAYYSYVGQCLPNKLELFRVVSLTSRKATRYTRNHKHGHQKLDVISVPR